MHYKTDNLSVTDTNQDFSKAENIAKENMTDDEMIDFAARRILDKYRAAFEELAK